MKYPKCAHVNPNGTYECEKCGVQFSDIRKPRNTEVDRNCPFNDHGYTCGKTGSLSNSTNGSGPWYCPEHFWKLHGREIHADSKPATSFRQRWHELHKLPYEAPKIGDMAGFRCVGTDAESTADRMFSGVLGKRTRQPGEDTPEDIGE